MFELVLTKAEFRLDVQVGNASFKQGSVRVPSDLEDYRNFLATLNGWSTSGRDIVPDAAFKKWNADNPKAPAKPPPAPAWSEQAPTRGWLSLRMIETFVAVVQQEWQRVRGGRTEGA
mgnify:CR=1 FL=1